MSDDSVQFSRQIRAVAAQMASRARGSRLGGAFSIADLLAVLYTCVLRVRPDEPRWSDRDPLLIRDGTERVALVATGGMLKTAIGVHNHRRATGRSIAVYSLPFLNPVSAELLAPLARYRTVVSVEEHVPEGGWAAVLRENLLAGHRGRLPRHCGASGARRGIAGLFLQHVRSFCRADCRLYPATESVR